MRISANMFSRISAEAHPKISLGIPKRLHFGISELNFFKDSFSISFPIAQEILARLLSSVCAIIPSGNSTQVLIEIPSKIP